MMPTPTRDTFAPDQRRMSCSFIKDKSASAAEARRLGELARAVGLGDSPDAAIQLAEDALGMLADEDRTPLTADILRWQGTVLSQRGRISDAEPLFQRSLHVSAEIGYGTGRAHALNCLAALAQRRGDVTAAAGMLTDALALAQRAEEFRLVGMLQQNLGIIADIRGNPAAALAHYRVSLRSFEAANDEQAVSWVLNNLGYLHVKENQPGEARECFDRALEIARGRGDLMTEGSLEENRAELALTLGELGVAERAVERALEIAVQRDDDARRAAALKLRGAWQRLSGSPSLSVDTLERALTSSAVGEDALLGAEILYQFGLALREMGRARDGDEVLRAALESFERLSARQWIGRVREQLINPVAGRYL